LADANLDYGRPIRNMLEAAPGTDTMNILEPILFQCKINR